MEWKTLEVSGKPTDNAEERDANFVQERMELMREEEIDESQIWDESEIENIKQILPMELTTAVPGMEKAIICGDPISLGDILDHQQGYDNPYGSFGTCGPTSRANLCIIGGKEVTEPEVVEYAMENDLCVKNDEKFHGGGTTIGQQIALLEHFGFPSHCELANETATPERLASAIEGGHGVLLGLNSGVLQDREWKVFNDKGEIAATHAVCLTGTVRDPDSGNLVGFYLCDSSGQTPESGRTFVPMDKFLHSYSDAKGSFAVITNDPIRQGYNYHIK